MTDDQLALLAQQVEEILRASGSAEVQAHDVGVALLGPLKDLDEVAYLRFASVYQGYTGIADFERALEDLKNHPRTPLHGRVSTE